MKSKKILIWGFYNQGNLGDDLMAAIFYEILEEDGHSPVILSVNPRFANMGYNSINKLTDLSFDLVLLGGGAFLKMGGSPESDIEKSISELANFIHLKNIPVIGASIGSDGITSIKEASAARRLVLQSRNFKGAAVRLDSNLKIELPKLTYLPDVVMCTKEATEKYSRLNVIEPLGVLPEVLINLSRRSAWQIPQALWLARGKRTSFYHAHTGKNKSGGEVTVPFISSISENIINKSLGYLKYSNLLISSKLHPGVIAISFGNKFIPLSPRPKTQEFLRSSINEKVALKNYKMFFRDTFKEF